MFSPKVMRAGTGNNNFFLYGLVQEVIMTKEELDFIGSFPMKMSLFVAMYCKCFKSVTVLISRIMNQ